MHKQTASLIEENKIVQQPVGQFEMQKVEGGDE
jgi:hypothetical protein